MSRTDEPGIFDAGIYDPDEGAVVFSWFLAVDAAIAAPSPEPVSDCSFTVEFS